MCWQYNFWSANRSIDDTLMTLRSQFCPVFYHYHYLLSIESISWMRTKRNETCIALNTKRWTFIGLMFPLFLLIYLLLFWFLIQPIHDWLRLLFTWFINYITCLNNIFIWFALKSMLKQQQQQQRIFFCIWIQKAKLASNRKGLICDWDQCNR